MAIKKVNSDKTAAKKTAAKKTTAKKSASPKKATPAKKSVAKKVVAKKVATEKAAAKKVTTKKVVAKKVAPKKTAAKRVTVKKAEGKEPVSIKAKAIKGKAGKSIPKEVKPKVIKDATQLLVDAAIEGIREIKGRGISILDLRHMQNRVCDYYIICQADSNTQVKSIAGSVEEFVRKLTGEKPYHTEGFQNSEWILVDYVTVVVHVFQTHIREFYNLESLWADAEVTTLPD